MAAISVHHTDMESPDSPLPSHQRPTNAAGTSSPKRLRLRTWGVVFVLVFLLELSGSLNDTPFLRICESIICKNYYKITDPSIIGNDGVVEERHCKTSPVQEELALLVGWLSFFNYLPGAHLLC